MTKSMFLLYRVGTSEQKEGKMERKRYKGQTHIAPYISNMAM